MKSFPEVANALFIYGSFSKPFLNMALAESDRAWKMYFLSIKYEWTRNHIKALEYAKRGLKVLERDSKKAKSRKSQEYFLDNPAKYEKGKNLFYLLSIQKLSILERIKSPQINKLYKMLKQEYYKMPNLARKIAAPTFFNHLSNENKNDVPKTRIWSKMYNEDISAWVFILLGKAREKAKSGDVSNAFSLFLKAFKVAKEIPHSTGIVNSLNDMAWYMRNIHPIWANGIAKQAVYWAGWYFEDVKSIFYTFDTLFECQRLSNDSKVYENGDVMILANEYLPKGPGRGSQARYHDRIKACKRIIPKFEVSRYENTKELRNYLKTQINNMTSAANVSSITRKSISVILSGKVKEVRGYTLKKLIKGLKIRVNPDDVPFAILNEYIKMKIEDEFKESIGKLEAMGQSERTVLFVSTYMAYFERRKSFSYLSRKGKLKEAFDLLNDTDMFKEFMEKRYETMEFVSHITNGMHPFLQARKDLAVKYLERMPKRTRERFIQRYLTLSDDEKLVIDRFARDYTRYDIHWGRWGMYVKLPKELEKYAKAFHLKKIPTAFSWWAYDTQKERNKLVEVLENFR